MGQAVERRQTLTCSSTTVRWVEMRCVRCRRLLQKIEENALRPGMRVEIKCAHCKVMNYSVGAVSAE